MKWTRSQRRSPREWHCGPCLASLFGTRTLSPMESVRIRRRRPASAGSERRPSNRTRQLLGRDTDERYEDAFQNAVAQAAGRGGCCPAELFPRPNEDGGGRESEAPCDRSCRPRRARTRPRPDAASAAGCRAPSVAPRRANRCRAATASRRARSAAGSTRGRRSRGSGQAGRACRGSGRAAAGPAPVAASPVATPVPTPAASPTVPPQPVVSAAAARGRRAPPAARWAARPVAAAAAARPVHRAAPRRRARRPGRRAASCCAP